jgi:uncharacterized membrane protein YphA (DoxX/SURF4 family)
MRLQRTFSSFPSGSPGYALLLLRLVVGASAAIQSGLMVASVHATLSTTIVAAISFGVAGLTLIVGFLTPIASLLACVGGAWVMTTYSLADPKLLFDSRMAQFEFMIMALALAILGPGAISLDARLFGRREVTIREE